MYQRGVSLYAKETKRAFTILVLKGKKLAQKVMEQEPQMDYDGKWGSLLFILNV